MARPQRNNVDYFPLWNPQKGTIRKITSTDKKSSYKVFRSSSSGFIAKPEVRQLILSKCNHKCKECGDTENLQVDHIKSVYKHFHERDFYGCNIEGNLQILCRTCNSSKLP